MRDYVHRSFDEQVVAIGGHYRLTDEVRLPFMGKDLLYLRGYAFFDTSCCGASGCAYALVQGFIEDWKSRQDSDGFFISRVRPVEDPDLQQKISRLIKSREWVQQVQFA